MDEFEDTPASNISPTCNSSEEFHHVVFAVKMSASCFSCVANLLAIIVMCCGGGFKRLLVLRLVLYLLIANLLLVIVQVFELIPVTYSDDYVHLRPGGSWEKACSALGFLDQVTAWIRDFVIFFIVVQLFVLVKNFEKFWEEQSEKSKRIEMLGVCLCFLLPFTFNWIPFLDGYYGLSGHWCWIKVTLVCGGSDVATGLMYMLVLYYVPLLVIVLITSLVSVYILFMWCKTRNRQCEVVLVILYPLVFDLLCIIMTANRIDSALHFRDGTTSSFALWILHALADSGRTILPPVFVLLLLMCRSSRDLLCNQRLNRVQIKQHKGLENHDASDNENRRLVDPS